MKQVIRVFLEVDEAHKVIAMPKYPKPSFEDYEVSNTGDQVMFLFFFIWMKNAHIDKTYLQSQSHYTSRL